jgi:hypothetical protein
MYNTIADALTALRATPEILGGLLGNVTHEQAFTAKGGDEGWSVVEVICHLRDAEEIAVQRIEAMRDHPNPAIAGYDQEALARQRNYATADLRLALGDFVRFRQQRIAILTALTPEQWERPAQHSEVGRITILEYCMHMTAHDAVHCAQIARQLVASGKQ